MGFLDNLSGYSNDTTQLEMLKALGIDVDPQRLQKQSQQQALLRLAEGLISGSAPGQARMAGLGAGLVNARGASNDVLNQQLQMGLQQKQLQGLVAQQTARKDQLAKIQELKNLPEWNDLPATMRGMFDVALAGGDIKTAVRLYQDSTKEKEINNTVEWYISNYGKEEGLRRYNADKNERQAIRGNAQRTQIVFPGEKKTADTFGTKTGEIMDEVNDNLRAAENTVRQLDRYIGLRGDAPRVPGAATDFAQTMRSVPGVGGVVESVYGGGEAMDRAQVADTIGAELAIPKFANLKPLSNSDVDFVLRAGPTLMKSQRGLRIMRSIAAESAERYRAVATRVNRMVEAGQLNPGAMQQAINDEINKMEPVSSQFWRELGYEAPNAQQSGSNDGWSATLESP